MFKFLSKISKSILKSKFKKSDEDVALYIESLKAVESKPVDALLGKSAANDVDQLISAITQVKEINKTDAMNMIIRFKVILKHVSNI